MNTKDYNHCVETYSDSLYRYLCRNYHDMEMAKDVVQSVFEKLWIKRDHLKMEEARAYLFTMARNKAIDIWRKNHRIVAIEDHHDRRVAQSSSQSFEDIDYARYCLRKLNEKQKTVLLLREYEGHSYEDISEITGLTLSQVKIILFRARKKVMDTVKKKSKAI